MIMMRWIALHIPLHCNAQYLHSFPHTHTHIERVKSQEVSESAWNSSWKGSKSASTDNCFRSKRQFCFTFHPPNRKFPPQNTSSDGKMSSQNSSLDAASTRRMQKPHTNKLLDMKWNILCGVTCQLKFGLVSDKTCNDFYDFFPHWFFVVSWNVYQNCASYSILVTFFIATRWYCSRYRCPNGLLLK